MLIDITLPLQADMIVYEGDPPFQLTREQQLQPNNLDSYNCSGLTMSAHAGTHVDAPLHFFEQGKTVPALSLDVLCGQARVLDLTGQGNELDEELFRGRHRQLLGVERLLLRTDNCRLLGQSFRRNYAHLTPAAARYLRCEIGIKLLGVDYLSVDGWPEPWPGFGFPVHHQLLAGEDPVVIVEGLDLRQVSAGEYELLCLPLPIVGADGAPARAVLRTLLRPARRE